MIDLHCHILNGIDDGARTLEDSLAMANAAIAEGISHILVTPHHKNGKYENRKEQIISCTEKLQYELKKRNIPLTLFPGQEIRIYGELMQDIANDEILFTDEIGRYLLIEFPTMTVPQFAESLFFQLMQQGISPVIVHPERNQVIIENPDILTGFIEKGAYAQLTASSYVGSFGKNIEKMSRHLIEANLVHVLASDAHNIRGRSFHLKEAYKKMEKEFGWEKALYSQENARNMINGDIITMETPITVKKRKKFFLF